MAQAAATPQNSLFQQHSTPTVPRIQTVMVPQARIITRAATENRRNCCGSDTGDTFILHRCHHGFCFIEVPYNFGQSKQ